jgi:RNase H-like domain found in reverse transcriptase
VVHALLVWRCYIQGPPITVVVDDSANTYLPNSPLSGRRAHWAEFFAGYDIHW